MRDQEADFRNQSAPSRVSTRKRHAPFRMGEDELPSDMEDDTLELPPPTYEPVPPRPNERRSHKKRRVDPADGFDELGRPSHKGGSSTAQQMQRGRNMIGKVGGAGSLHRRKDDDTARPMDAMWSPEEDAALLKAINAFGSSNWELVADVLASLAPARYRSPRACYDRCSHVLLPMEDGPREPGSLVSETSGSRDAPGSLASLPESVLGPMQPPSMSAAMQANAVGDAMRAQESIRANSLQTTVLQAETTAQCKTFGLVAKLISQSRAQEQHRLQRLHSSLPQHASQAAAATRAFSTIAEAAAALPKAGASGTATTDPAVGSAAGPGSANGAAEDVAASSTGEDAASAAGEKAVAAAVDADGLPSIDVAMAEASSSGAAVKREGPPSPRLLAATTTAIAAKEPSAPPTLGHSGK